MQFQVPQFIYIEDKLVGPLTFRQFLYIAIPVAIIGILFFVLEFKFWAITAIFLGGGGGVLAFGKVNGRPISIFLIALVDSVWKPNFYIFKLRTPIDVPIVKPLHATKDGKGFNLSGLMEKFSLPRIKSAPKHDIKTEKIKKKKIKEHKITLSSFPETKQEKIEHTLPAPPPAIKTKKTTIKKVAQSTKTPSFGGINELREWLATSKTAIPRREEPLPKNFGVPKKDINGRYEVVRHITGVRELAKRIDYR